MKYLRSEFPLAIALIRLAVGFTLEHAAVEQASAALWGLLLVILAAIIAVAFRIAHHAEVLAMRFGGPYGTLILTLAAASGEGFIAMLLVAIGIGMFIPDFVPESQWQIYSVFSVGVMAIMYLAFLRLQTVEHRRFFEYTDVTEEEAHDLAHSPNALHVGVMLGAIALVGLLSEVLSVLLDAGFSGSGLPKALPAVLVPLIPASPEILTALRAAQKDRMQTTVNIALGASLATVLLTLPVIETIALLSGERIA